MAVNVLSHQARTGVPYTSGYWFLWIPRIQIVNHAQVAEDGCPVVFEESLQTAVKWGHTLGRFEIFFLQLQEQCGWD